MTTYLPVLNVVLREITTQLPFMLLRCNIVTIQHSGLQLCCIQTSSNHVML
jgi:hypothetical protein